MAQMSSKKQSFRVGKTLILILELSGSFAELLTLRLHGNGADVCQGKTVTVEARLDRPSVAKTQINKHPEQTAPVASLLLT